MQNKMYIYNFFNVKYNLLRWFSYPCIPWFPLCPSQVFLLARLRLVLNQRSECDLSEKQGQMAKLWLTQHHLTGKKRKKCVCVCVGGGDLQFFNLSRLRTISLIQTSLLNTWKEKFLITVLFNSWRRLTRKRRNFWRKSLFLFSLRFLGLF